MFFKKKKKEAVEDSKWQGIQFGTFLIQVPKDWTYEVIGGKIKANKGDEIRLTVSGWQIDKSEYDGLHGALEGLQNGYAQGGYKPSSEVRDYGKCLSQTLALDGEDCCVIGITEKEYKGDLIILNLVFNTYDQDDLLKNQADIEYMLNNIPVLVN